MRKINKIKLNILLLFVFCFLLAVVHTSSGSTRNTRQPVNLFSPPMSQEFYEIAYDLASSDNISYVENELAISFLVGAMKLDDENSDVRSLLLRCLCRFPEQISLNKELEGETYFDLAYNLLQEQIETGTDITLLSDAAAFLTNQINSVDQKLTLLEQILKLSENKNPLFASEIATQIGLLKLQDDSVIEAERYFRQAYKANIYNRLAFSKLYEMSPEKISPTEFLERLRLDFRENPIDIRTVLNFCQGLEKYQLYDTAAEAYEYCSDLFSYLYPSETLPVDIYIPWAISCYNSKNNQSKCLEIAETIRKTGKFDITLESLAGRAASKLGQDTDALQIISSIEKNAYELLGKQSLDITEAQMAWFYSFVLPMPDTALEWANKAFAANPKSPIEASLLAYSLTQKKEFSTAISIMGQFPSNQITELTLAQIQLEEGSRVQGIENLKKAISHDPGSFEAERAKDILARNGEKYVPPVSIDSVLAGLNKVFGKNLIPDFISPEKMFSIALNIRDRELTFNGDLDCAVSINNKSSESLVLSDESMFKGNIRIDASVNGDLSKRIPNLVSKRIKGIIEPGKSKIVRVKLITGELKEMLLTHPQASLNITFNLYIDPVRKSENQVVSNIAEINPVPVIVTRPPVIISAQSIRNLVKSISASQSSEKIKNSELFVGLLKEQEALLERTSPYRTVFTNEMKSILMSALVKDSGLLRESENSGWVVKVFTMSDLLSFPLNIDILKAVSENMYNENWPVRMMAVYLLAENQGQKFGKVLEAIYENENNSLVKNVAELEMLKNR